MTRSIYDEMCKPSPLSKPPKPEVKMLTREEFEVELEAAREAIRIGVGTGALSTALVKRSGQ